MAFAIEHKAIENSEKESKEKTDDDFKDEAKGYGKENAKEAITNHQSEVNEVGNGLIGDSLDVAQDQVNTLVQELGATFCVHFAFDFFPLIGGLTLLLRATQMADVIKSEWDTYLLVNLRYTVFWSFASMWILYSLVGGPFGIFALHGTVIFCFGKSLYGLKRSSQQNKKIDKIKPETNTNVIRLN